MSAMQRNALSTLFATAVLTTVSLVVFHPATFNQFVSDDFHYFNYNELWISSFRTEHLFWMFTSFELWNWHPLTWISWALDYKLYGGLSPRGFHLSNNVLHSLNSMLTFLLFRKFLHFSLQGRKLPADESRILWASFFAALLFAVHPQHVESVAWVSSRQHLLCHAFLLLATLAYLRHHSGNSGHSLAWLRVSAVCFLFAGLAKPTAIVFPFVLIIIDIYPLRRMELSSASRQSSVLSQMMHLLLEKRNFIILAALLAIPTLLARTTATHDIALIDRVLNAVSASLFYLEKLVWPVNYSTYYSYFVEQGGPHGFEELISVLIFVLITILCLVSWRKGQPWWLAAWAFYLLTLAPVIGIIPTGPQGGADRYAYMPTVPVYMITGAGIYYLFKACGKRMIATLVLALVMVSIFLSSQTLRQIGEWETNLTVWSNAYGFFPEDAYVNHQLGAAFLEEGQLEPAVGHFRRAYQQDRSKIQSLAWLSLVNIRMKRYEEALQNSIELGEHAATGAPPFVDEYCLVYNISWLLAQLRRFDEAMTQFGIMPPTGDYQALTHEWKTWLASTQSSEKSTEEINQEIARLPGSCIAPLFEMRRRPLDPPD